MNQTGNGLNDDIISIYHFRYCNCLFLEADLSIIDKMQVTENNIKNGLNGI